jgi:hypothetical protein
VASPKDLGSDTFISAFTTTVSVSPLYATLTEKSGGGESHCMAGGRGFGLELAFDFGCPMVVP